MIRFASIVALAGALFLVASAAQAIPALQLGSGSGSWSYDTSSQTWVTSDNPLNLLSTANATTGNGDYAWEQTGTTQTAYLIASATPKGTAGDAFDITVQNDGGMLSLYTSGYGNPPLNDPNSLAPHGIWDTYFEVYEFQFDGPVVTISDTQPGTSGTGDGYVELFDITINSISAAGIHFDLFTVNGDGIWDPSSADDKWLMEAFAPYSHDAETGELIPEPGAALLFGLGAIIVSRRTRR